MLRDKIDKLGYDYLGRQYLYLNIVGDVLVYIKECITPKKNYPLAKKPDDPFQEKWPYQHSSESTHSEHIH